MKAVKVIKLMFAGALALGLSEIASAKSIQLNSPLNYTNDTNHTAEFVDYFSFSLTSLSNVTFNYTDSGLLSNSTLSIFSDKGKVGPNLPDDNSESGKQKESGKKNDAQTGGIAFITSSSGSWSATGLAAGKYYLLVDAFLPKQTVTEHDYYSHHHLYHEDIYTPSTGRFTLTAYSATAVTPVPEPGVFVLMLSGLGLVGFMSYRRQRYFN